MRVNKWKKGKQSNLMFEAVLQMYKSASESDKAQIYIIVIPSFCL